MVLVALFLAASTGTAGCLAKEDLGLYTGGLSHPQALLVSDPLPDLLVEIDYVASLSPPSDTALEALEQVLEDNVQKREIIILDPTPVDRSLPEEPTHEEARALMAATFDNLGPAPHRLDTYGTLHILYANGAPSDRVGTYYASGPGSGIVVYPETWYGSTPVVSVRTGADGVTTPYDPLVERAVVIHELGHAFGLVDCGIPMVHPHEDPDSQCHSNNSDSVMWSLLSTQILTGSPIPSPEPTWRFDDNDLLDIRTFQSRFQAGIDP